MRFARSRVALAAPFAILLVAALPRSSDPSVPQEVQIKAVAAAGSVHMLEGKGGNIGISIGPDGVLMIDDQFADVAPKVQAAIDSLAGAAQAPRYLVNTHFHSDHTGANAIFGARATVIAHDNVRKRLLGPAQRPMPAEGLPVVTYSSTAAVHFNGEEVRLIHYPTSHTDGDTVVWFTRSNVVHLGDLFFHQRFPFIDLDGGGSVVGLERSIADLLVKLPADVKLIPGHGPLASLADLKSYRAMLADSIAIVRGALEAGKGGDEIASDKMLGKYDNLSWQFISTEKFTQTLVRELSSATTERR